MDLENITSWLSQPDVCRCCLSTSGAFDLTASYISNANTKELYFEMIHECFGITISYLKEWGPSRMVCELCVGQLRNACDFKKKVTQSELHFIETYHKKKDRDVLPYIKNEDIKSEDDLGDVDYDHGNTIMDCADIKENFEENKVQSKERKTASPKAKLVKRKKQAKKTDVPDTKHEDYDSDVPISRLTTNRSHEETQNDRIIPKNKEILNDSDGVCRKNNYCDAPSGTTANLQAKSATKQLSERKRFILTSNVVLKNTTACPFRHHKSWFQCFFCQQEFMEINLLRIHITETHLDVEKEFNKLKRYPRSLQIDISALKCVPCSLNLSGVDDMKRHFEDVHKNTIYKECIADYKVNTSPYTCHLCDQEFHVFRSLTTHLNEHYANCICDVCGKSFMHSKRLKVHKRTHEKGNFPCNECGKILKTKTSKANHMESAHSKRILKCHICAEPMKHYHDRIKHMSLVHDITHKFKCNICAKEYNVKHYLATHMRQSHGHKNKKCTDCGMAFRTNHGLKKHMVKHTGEKPYVCHVCCKSYARNYTLREHMRTHGSDNRFLCPE